MKRVDDQFCDLLDKILVFGEDVDTRNSITRRAINMSMSFDSTPLVSVRRTAWKLAIREFEWFMSGSSNINDLHPSVHSWWKPWANKDGEILNNYSKQFRSFSGEFDNLDQINYLIETMRDHPFSRRAVITTWNTAEMVSPSTPITNCHGTLIQTFVSPETNKLSMSMYQRSVDTALGLPHNLIQYWAFLLYLAKQTGRGVGKFNWIGGDCHIYQNHMETCLEMIAAEANTFIETPNLVYSGNVGDPFRADDFTLDGPYTVLLDKKLSMTV